MNQFSRKRSYPSLLDSVSCATSYGALSMRIAIIYLPHHRFSLTLFIKDKFGRKPLLLEILVQGFQLTRRPNIYDFETSGQAGRPVETHLGKSGRTNVVPGCWESCLEKSGSGLFRNRKQITPDQLRRQVLPLWNGVLKYSAIRGQIFPNSQTIYDGQQFTPQERMKDPAAWPEVVVIPSNGCNTLCSGPGPTLENARQFLGWWRHCLPAHQCMGIYSAALCMLTGSHDLCGIKESARQKGREIRRSIPARRQIAMDAPITWWKKRTCLVTMGTCQELVVRGIGNACYGPPLTFSPGMDPVEWLESMEDFFVVTSVPSSQQAASAKLSVNIAVRRELFPPASPRDIPWDELKRRFLDIYGQGESLLQLTDVAEFRRRAGKSESELVVRFICGVSSKEVHRELRLREPTALVKARQLAENAAELETEVGRSRQRTTENADAGNDNLAQAVEALTRRFDQLQTTLERSNSRRSARRGTECFRCGEQGHFLRDCPQRQTGTRPARALNNGNGDRRLLAMTALQAGHAPSVTGKLNGLEISLLLDSGAVVSVVPLSIWHKSTGREPLEAAGGSILLRARTKMDDIPINND
ncbi:hypothetical protein T05_16076 [Trichinella murrelli]|uniref:CCHC-type domain-containing protein n=1 Tax=Trichinella murrelli TaxID=144512 RepID=A0A0V0UEP8_9BILA|nr:hypothetical protein T05_16076 [Trichinella murrelli]